MIGERRTPGILRGNRRAGDLSKAFPCAAFSQAGAARTGGEPGAMTPLQKCLDRLGIPSSRVEEKLRARLSGTWPSRQQMARWRHGRAEVRRKDMVRILWAVREVSGDPDVRIEDLFDLDPGNPDNWRG